MTLLELIGWVPDEDAGLDSEATLDFGLAVRMFWATDRSSILCFFDLEGSVTPLEGAEGVTAEGAPVEFVFFGLGLIILT